jgi:O-antigen ligase
MESHSVAPAKSALKRRQARANAKPGRIARLLRRSPIVVPALGALALFVAWSTNQGGYPLTHWAPGALIVLILLGIAAGWIPVRVEKLPRAVLVALTGMALYTAWSFLSILWAGVPGDAWEGADRTLLYLLVFALFATWRMRGEAAALLVVVWTLALTGVAAFVVVHLDTLGGLGLEAALPEGRLAFPAGYVNANAAQWMMVAFPALLLARSGRLHPVLRGALAGGAVLLTDVALLSLSRGSVFASAALLVIVFALAPGRVRTFAVLLPVLLGVAVSTPLLLKVGDRLQAPEQTQAAASAAENAVHNASVAMFAAAVLVGLAVALASGFERGHSYWPRARGPLRRAVTVAAVVTVVAGIGGAFAAVGNPVARISHEWDTFTSSQGYSANEKGNRLISGLGSSRYDFYRVALDEFAAHPLLGIGADNFAQQYLRKGHSNETPHYPHSVELRTLVQTGLVGAALALVGLIAALFAAGRAIRRADGVGRATAAAALAGFGYWAVHGSVDWFFEYAGLGAPAFAMLGIACALDRGRAVAQSGPLARARQRLGQVPMRPLVLGLPAAAVALVVAASLAAPWLSGLEQESAARVWAQSRTTAYARLKTAAELDPLSAEPYLVAGSIAIRLEEFDRADHEFALALGRVPQSQYAILERGTIASQRGEGAEALRLLQRAVELYPRDNLAHAALAYAREGVRISVALLNAQILKEGQELQ